MKTRKAAAKRYSVTGSGKVNRRKAGLRHHLEGRTRSSKNKAGKAALVHGSEVEKVKRMLPYAF